MQSIYSVYDPVLESAPLVVIDRTGSLDNGDGTSTHLFDPITTDHPQLKDVLGDITKGRPYGSKFSKSSFADNPETVRESRDLLLEGIDLMSIRADDELEVIELDNLTKANYMKGQSPLWSVQETILGAPDASEYEFPEALILATADWLSSKRSKDVSMTESIPLGRNTGYPFFTPGASYLNDLDSYLSGLLAGNKGMTARATYDMVASFTKKRWNLDPAFVTFKRPRATAKLGREWTLKPDSVSSITSSRGKAPKHRKVLGSAKFESLIGRSLSISLKEICAGCPSLDTGSDLHNLSILLGYYDKGKQKRFSADISGMDTSCGSKLISGVWQLFKLLVPTHPYYSIIDDINNRGAFCANPWDGENSVLYCFKDGGIASGVITTDLENSLMNLMLQVYCYAKVYDISFSTAYKKMDAKEWFVKVKGDDSTSIVPKDYDFRKHEIAALELGFKMDPLPGTAFLMTYFDINKGTYYGLVGRALMQTLWRENDAVGPYTELFGLITRWTRCKNNPYYRDFFNLLRKHSGFNRIQSLTSVIIDSSNLPFILSDPIYLAGLMKELRGSSGQAWLIDTIRGLTRGTGDWSEVNLPKELISKIRSIIIDPSARKITCNFNNSQMLDIVKSFADLITYSSEEGVTKQDLKESGLLKRFLLISGADQFVNINLKLVI